MRVQTPLRAAVLLTAGSASAFGQCAMCRNAVAAQSPGAIESFNLAILILLVPATVFFSGVFWFSFRFRNEAAETGEESARAEDANP